MWKEFYEKYIAQPDVEPQSRLFSPEHIFLSAIIITAIVLSLVYIIRKRINTYKLLRILAVVMLSLEAFRFLWKIIYRGLTWDVVRFDWCNQVCLFMPIMILCNWKRGYDICFPMAFIGGFAVLLYPLTVFYDYAGIHIMAVQSMVSHGLMVFMALLLPLSGQFRPTLRCFKWGYPGFLVTAVVAFGMSFAHGQNYMSMLSAGGIPVLSLIPWPWYIPVFLAAVALGFFLVYKCGELAYGRYYAKTDISDEKESVSAAA